MSLTESKGKIKKIEEEIFKEVCRIGCEVYREYLEGFDKHLEKERDRKKYRHKGKRKTVLKTVMGEVEYIRNIYQFVSEEGVRSSVYLLDIAMGEDKIGNISGLLAEKIAESICKATYRGTSEMISELTGQRVSQTGVWNVVQALGRKLDNRELQNAKAAERSAGKGKLETKVLFEEQDGVYLNLQGKDRKENGKKAEMKVAIAYEGCEKTGKNRYELSNKVAVASIEKADKFCVRKEGAIAEKYNVDEILMRVLNGDGAKWIKRSIKGENAFYQLDPFHRNKAIREYVQDEEIRTQIFEFLYSEDTEGMLEYIEAVRNSVEDMKQQEDLEQLLKYFTNNKEGLVCYNRRGLDIPEAKEGLEYRNMGTMESNIFTIIGNRMKGRRANWSIKGGNNLAKLLTLKASKCLNETIANITPIVLGETYSQEIKSPLTAAKSLCSVGSGYNGYASAPIPNLPWAKGLFKIKPFSDLKF